MAGIRGRFAQPSPAKKSVVRKSAQSLTLGVVAIASSSALAVAATTFIAADWQGVTATGTATITDQNDVATLNAKTSAQLFRLSGNPEITVVAEVSGTGVGFRRNAITETLNVREGAAGMFFDDGLLTERALTFLSTSTTDPSNPSKHCVPSVDCKDNLGFITLTFSEPVSNPVLSFSGLGGYGSYDATKRALGSWAELEFVSEDSVGAQGITRLTGTTGFIVDGDSITVNGDLPSTRCQKIDTFLNGTTTPAGCGSIVVNGSNVETIVFRTYLRSTAGFVLRKNPQTDTQFLYEDRDGVVLNRAANRPFIDTWSVAVSIGHTFTIAPLAVTANPQAQTIPADQPYSGSAVVSGNTENASYRVFSDPSSGTVVMQADGSFVYTPNPGFTGTDEFVYELCHPDDASICTRSTITLTISPADTIAQTGGERSSLAQTRGEVPPFWLFGAGLFGVGAAAYAASMTIRRRTAAW